jgi:hypothetical protein
VVNAGNSRADACQFQIPAGSPVTMGYQMTNGANQFIGEVDAAFSINPGITRSFVLSFTPTAQNAGSTIFPQVVCTNGSVVEIGGVNNLFLSIDDHAVPDILSISATPSADGIVNIPAGATGFFSASALNFGAGDDPNDVTAAAQIVVSIEKSNAQIPVLLQVCETDAAGLCSSALGGSVTSTIGGFGGSFFAIFITDQSNGSGIALDPANTRAVLKFTDAGGIVRSVTSVALAAPAQ